MLAEVTTNVDAGTAFSLAGLLHVVTAAIVTTHVLLHKQNEGAAFAWIGMVVLSPIFGVLLYWLFGINRIRRRALAELPSRPDSGQASPPVEPPGTAPLPADIAPRWQALMRLGLAIDTKAYLPGNTMDVLIDGDEAYPVMLEAIEQARHTVVLSSYIFEYDAAGQRFVDALVAAHQRGVLVRVLIDGIGVGYGFSLERADRQLRRQGVRTARFLSTLSTTGTRFINLRNHRKILAVDGKVAFVGGMNIRIGNELDTSPAHPTQDVHFRVTGPVIDQISDVFTDDWHFAAGERLELPTHVHHQAHGAVCRVLHDGPDDNYQKLALTLTAAINAAQHSIRIATPYFLPGHTIAHALQLAALRGVRVEVLIPRRNNLRIVGWAMQANEARLIRQGIRLYKSEPPFDHSKLFCVDDQWSLVGSSNWDARSLELNFEINVECFDAEVNRQLTTLFNGKRDAAHRVRMPGRPLMLRLRNNFCRLFSPYL